MNLVSPHDDRCHYQTGSEDSGMSSLLCHLAGQKCCSPGRSLPLRPLGWCYCTCHYELGSGLSRHRPARIGFASSNAHQEDRQPTPPGKGSGRTGLHHRQTSVLPASMERCSPPAPPPRFDRNGHRRRSCRKSLTPACESCTAWTSHWDSRALAS
eukprot:COSAG02_NODE_2286_length_9213_cov_149.155914_4_plen_155_part_00